MMCIKDACKSMKARKKEYYHSARMKYEGLAYNDGKEGKLKANNSNSQVETNQQSLLFSGIWL